MYREEDCYWRKKQGFGDWVSGNRKCLGAGFQVPGVGKKISGFLTPDP
jgi:hypothetical protein